MYWGGVPQKTAPEEALQSTSQLGGSMFAVRLAWQSMFACTWHEAWQLAWHSAVQSAMGGTASHWIPQRLGQSSMQSEAQPDAWPLQIVVQLAWQSEMQDWVQLKLPGSAVQL